MTLTVVAVSGDCGDGGASSSSGTGSAVALSTVSSQRFAVAGA